MTRTRLPGWIAALVVALGVFSLGFSLLAERGLWPELPPGALHDTDLVAGFAAAVGLIWLLWREKATLAAAAPPPPPDPAAESFPADCGTEDGTGSERLPVH